MKTTMRATKRIEFIVIVMMGFVLVSGCVAESGKDRSPMMWKVESDGWFVVNDGVMGGISQSRVTLTDRKTLIFSGTVSLENNGGFASIRHAAEAFDIGSGSGILIRVRGDGNTYQLRVRTSDRFDGIAYKADFTTEKGVWQELRIPWDAFTATFHGREVKEAPELKGPQIQQVGFLIAEKQDGDFQLEIKYLGSLGPEE